MVTVSTDPRPRTFSADTSETLLDLTLAKPKTWDVRSLTKLCSEGCAKCFTFLNPCRHFGRAASCGIVSDLEPSPLIRPVKEA